ncbi:TetR/AcrR family transcriptional regulator [Roseisolibacter sp. H3M3-2]|uniref:TetR/AcrR family transcriptional regulator n=1 Tax=Roseisolibacter sp. H3M3-2 TaxID=3031323 RepID=UPI0023DA22B4|nr:TetR/AcrR family transcriptional regulator [Roseisolibacter sp. H3M3-2]MDF1503449.1 TetR/AcrR family transcriptional regulator [Roseisolibacter sp. H3M3-2]
MVNGAGGGRPKGDKRARTRARLLDAALSLTREQGFERTTLQQIAERAGVSTGAIYGNFRNRDDLFMALAERQWGPVTPAFRPGDSFATLMEAMAAATLEALRHREPAAVGALTFRAYALRHDDVRSRFRDVMAAGYDGGAAWLRANFDERELPMAPDVLVRVIDALVEGLTFQRLLTPELVTDAVVHAAFRALTRSS